MRTSSISRRIAFSPCPYCFDTYLLIILLEGVRDLFSADENLQKTDPNLQEG